MSEKDNLKDQDWVVVCFISTVLPLCIWKLSVNLYPVDELEKPSITMTPLEGEAKRKEIDEQLNMQYSGILILCCFIIMMSFLLSFYFRSGASKTVISGMIYGGLATVIISMGVYSGELNPFAQLLICGLVLGVLIVIPFVFPHVLTSATKNQYDRERES